MPGLHGFRRPSAAVALAVALLVHTDGAIAGAPIIGQWCGIEDYKIAVAPDGVAFQPRRGYYAPPAFDVKVSSDRADYRQRYDSLDVTVSCRLTLKDAALATESCDEPSETFYPKAGQTAELHRCTSKPEPSV